MLNRPLLLMIDWLMSGFSAVQLIVPLFVNVVALSCSAPLTPPMVMVAFGPMVLTPEPVTVTKLEIEKLLLIVRAAVPLIVGEALTGTLRLSTENGPFTVSVPPVR